MRKVICCGILTLGVFIAMVSLSFANESIWKAADAYRIEKSYALALDNYKKIDLEELNKNQLREINVKTADVEWRTVKADLSEESVKVLKEYADGKKHDQWWAEASESLSEYYLKVNRWQHREEVKKYLQQAREYWAGSKDLEVARPRFVKNTFLLVETLKQNGWHHVGIQPVGVIKKSILPKPVQKNSLSVLYEELLQVVKDDEERAKIYHYLALSVFHNYQIQEKKTAVDLFRKVIEEFPNSEWVDDSYYYLGQYYQNQNNLVKAVDVYQEFLTKFRKGESQWVDDAQNRIKNITSPQINLSTGYIFLPGSEVQFNLSWRNVSGAKMALYQLDLTKQLELDLSKKAHDSYRGINNYQDMMRRLVESNDYARLPQVMAWHQNLKNEKKYQHHSANKGLAEWRQEDEKSDLRIEDGVLETGAYLLVVDAGSKKVYDLVLVTDVGVVTKTGGHSSLVYAFDSFSGEPLPKTQVKYQYRFYNDRGQWAWEQGEGFTDEEGVLKVEFKTSKAKNHNNQRQLFVVVNKEGRQAFAQGNYYRNYGQNNKWWLYAYTDRPAYRPNETVSFKATMRIYDDTTFQTPSGEKIHASIYDPRGNQIIDKEFVLNEFGSLTGELVLDDKAPLGEYRMEIRDKKGGSHLNQAALFRLEEYKLPEFKVQVTPKTKEDGSSAYKVGDEIQLELDAQYYFGGAVAEADVEYLIYQKPYYHYYRPVRPFAWYYTDNMHGRHGGHHYGKGTLVTQKSIKTDGEGKATFKFETPETSNQDYLYTVEVRIVDQSRREITSSSDIKVTRQGFYAYLTPKNHLYRPGDKAEVDVKLLTANNDPIKTDGKVTVSRNWWTDAVLREGVETKPAGYAAEELFTRFVTTNDKGDAVFTFEPERDGYYTIVYTGYDDSGDEITSQAQVFVCAKTSQDLGYRYNGLQIIAEKDTYAVGETARVMLVADKPNSWVLFSAEADEIFHHKVFHLDGTVKLVEFPVLETFTPNIFLNVVSTDKHQLKVYNLPLIVPPDDKFLNIEIVSDKEVYRPQEEGVFDITVTDKNGEPVASEVALSIVDDSVYYIQSEYAKDIREFFYGTKRQQSIQTNASYYQKQYRKLVRNEESVLMEEDVLQQLKKRENKAGDKDDFDKKVGDRSRVDGIVLAESEVTESSTGARSKNKGASLKKSFNRGNVALASAPMAMDAIGQVEEKVSRKERNSNETGGSLQTAQVRQDFRSTVLWQPFVETDTTGKAQLSVKFPDSLTTWRSTARAVTPDTSVGTATQETRTKKDIIVRLQAPRFFTERDEVIISANVHNYTDTDQRVLVKIETEGLEIENAEDVWVDVPASGEHRVDWNAKAVKSGSARIQVSGQSDADADAMVKNYPVIPHGIEKFIAQSVSVQSQGDDSQTSFVLNVPRERIPSSTSLQLTLSPSLAGALLDALPYLADYPYGCVEQTMSRFLPAVIVQKTLRDLGLTDEEVNSYINSVLIPREDPDHPQRRNDMTISKLEDMTQAGLNRLYDFQQSNGGWGWWKESRSNRFMSAYVVWGLALAKDAGISIDQNALNKGIRFLTKELVEEENRPDNLAWMLHALSVANSSSKFEDKQIERLWKMRDELNPYTRSLFALALHERGDEERSQVVARNLINGIEEDKDNGTAHWGRSGVHYRWSEGGVEATAFVIKALSNILPDSEYLKPAVKWMALNRRGARWKNTRDTAIAILGLSDYLATTSELVPDFEYSVTLNGEVLQSGRIDRSNVFDFNRYITLNNDQLQDGDNNVEVQVKGSGALYASGYLKYFTLEEDISPAGNEIFVERSYSTEDTGETLLKGLTTDWRALSSGESVTSGQRIKVEMILEAKNHYEYLILEDFKPAGLEAVSLKSGSAYAERLDSKGKPSGERVWVYQEFRDQKAVFFVDDMKQGKILLSYELRAEVPGEFHAMPNQAHAMYVPEIRANSSEMIVGVSDRE